MIRAGLTGGLASGKSFVGRELERLGCHLVRADDLGHRVLERGGEAYEPVVSHFGPEIVDADGNIDRKALAGKVFGNSAELAFLNGTVHPAVIRMEEEFIHAVENREPDAIAVVEAAILIETGSYKRFDRLILVVCTDEQQIARAMRRDGCTREEAEARLRRQMPLEEKRKYADYVIDTSGTKENTIEQTRRVFEALRGVRQD